MPVTSLVYQSMSRSGYKLKLVVYFLEACRREIFHDWAEQNYTIRILEAAKERILIIHLSQTQQQGSEELRQEMNHNFPKPSARIELATFRLRSERTTTMLRRHLQRKLSTRIFQYSVNIVRFHTFQSEDFCNPSFEP